MLTARQHDAADGHHVHLLDDVTDDGERVLANLAVRSEVIRTDQIKIVDLSARNEFIDLDRARDLDGDRLDFLVTDLDVTDIVDLIALDDLVWANFFAGVLFDLVLSDAVAVFIVYL